MSTGKTAMTAVQAAVMAMLALDGTLVTLVPGGIWDYVPADPVWPYLCLESASEEPYDTFGKQGRTVRLTFTVFSDYQGRSEQFAILNQLVASLRHVKLTGLGSPDPLAGWEHLATWYVGGVAVSPFDVGNTRAGSSQAMFEVQVMESAS